jgi:hypothetical protein
MYIVCVCACACVRVSLSLPTYHLPISLNLCIYVSDIMKLIDIEKALISSGLSLVKEPCCGKECVLMLLLNGKAFAPDIRTVRRKF